MATEIENAGINLVKVWADDTVVYVVGNEFVNRDSFGLDIDWELYKLSEKIHYPTMKSILAECSDIQEIERQVCLRAKELSPKHITYSDILVTLSYELNLFYGIGETDDIDHLGNRRVRAVGELLQNQFRIGLSRMERVVRERMSTQDPDMATPQGLINIRPVVAAMKEFFGSSQLSQFMDQTNDRVISGKLL